MTAHPTPTQRTIFLLVVASVCGALAGAAAGFVTASIFPVNPSAMPIRVGSTSSTATVPAAPTTTFALIPLENRPTASVLPPAFAKRGVSAVATVYRKPKGTAIEDRMLTDDRLLGQAVALTSDGWYVTTASVIDSLHPADIVLWHDGKSYAVDRGVIDHLTNTVFLKTSATNLPPSAFAHLQDLQAGAEIWLESRPGELVPKVTRSVTARSTTDPVTSESISRRIVLDAMTSTGDVGAAAWDPNGSLVGLVESAAGQRISLIPAASIGASFTSLLTNGEIRHASLGVRTIDLADLRVDGDSGFPASGALVRDDSKTKRPGVAAASAAAKAKIQSGDVILRVDRDILDGSADLGEVLSDYQPGTPVTLRVVRNGADSDVPVTLGQIVTSEPLK